MRNSGTNDISTALPVARLLVGRQDVLRTFPRREEIEIAEFLREPHRLVHDALLLVVVAHLHESRERKIPAQRVALESIIPPQPAHVPMAGKEHALEAASFPVPPISAPATPPP